MSNEEIKEVKETKEQKNECNCMFCKSVKKVLTIALGTFIGFYCAMSMFFALHRPPMMHHGHFYKKHHQGIEQGFYHRGKFKGEHPRFSGQMPPMQGQFNPQQGQLPPQK